MARSLSLVLIVMTALPMAAGEPAPGDLPEALRGRGYVLAFADEFNGTALDPTVWGPRLDRSVNRPGMDYWNEAEALSLSGGDLCVAIMCAERKGRQQHIGGGAITKARFGYGYYETWCKPFLGGRGVHTSFWQTGMGSNRLFEIDGLEVDSFDRSRNTVARLACHNLYVHAAPRGFPELPWPLRANTTFRVDADGWYRCGWEYTPDGVTFFEGTAQIAQVRFRDYPAAQNVWLTALHGVGTVDATNAGESRFAYFRYYARPLPGVNLLPNGDFEYNLDRDDPQIPRAWSEDGDAAASRIVDQGAACGRYALRQGNETEASYRVRTHQTLQHLLPGVYRISARCRSPGGLTAARLVATSGAVEVAQDLPAQGDWQTVSLEDLQVADGSVTIAVASEGPAGTWLEVDDVRVEQPATAEHPQRPTVPFRPLQDAMWTLGEDAPVRFVGDESFYFFGRNVGCGPAITVAFRFTPGPLVDQGILGRIPAKGPSGWGVVALRDGSIGFRVGSRTEAREVRSSPVLVPGRATDIACRFDRGTATIMADGVVVASASGITQDTTDTTAAGRLGNVDQRWLAVGDVIQRDEDAPVRPSRFVSLSGEIRHLAIYNRALSDDELRAGPQR